MSASKRNIEKSEVGGIVDIQGEKVRIKGDVVGRDKVSYGAGEIAPRELDELLHIIDELKNRTAALEEIQETQKEQVISLLEAAEEAAKDPSSGPEEIAQNLNAVQKILEAISGIGAVSMQLFPLIAEAMQKLLHFS